MPITNLKILSPETKLALWEINEAPAFFENLLHIEPRQNFAKDTRNLHWLASRILLQELINEQNLSLRKDEYGKPYLENSPWKISISHSGNFAAAMASKNGEVGIDIEHISDRIRKIAHKFIREDEKELLQQNELDMLFLIWSSKESLYKLFGQRELDFREHLRIHPFELRDSGNLKASIVIDGFEKDYTVEYEKRGEYMLTWVASGLTT